MKTFMMAGVLLLAGCAVPGGPQWFGPQYLLAPLMDATEDEAEIKVAPLLDKPIVLSPYNYQATVASVYDADTVTLVFDLGLGVQTTQRVRLYGVNAWEVRGEERIKGLFARDWLRRLIPPGTTVGVRTIKDSRGKYGRYLCVLWLPSDGGKPTNINRQLVDKGHGRYVAY